MKEHPASAETPTPHIAENPSRPAPFAPNWHREDSRLEEIIGTLWLIAALLAWIAGIHWLAWPLFAKSALDHMCAIVFGCVEIKRRKKDQ